MWSLTITSPKSKPLQLKLTSGKMSIGRLLTCDIVINDDAASRRHAEIYFDSMTEMLSITDLKSSNGTIVNGQKISGFYRLHDGDVIRIGQTEMHLVRMADTGAGQKEVTGTSLLTRAAVLEAVDEHPIELNEITEQLNTVVDLEAVTLLVGAMLKQTLGVDVCQIVPASDFKLVNMEDPDDLKARTIRNSSIEVNQLTLCIPVIAAGKPYGLMYLQKERPDSTPFDKREIQLAVGISHQTALALQRIELLEKIRREGQAKQFLLRFISPLESEDLLKDYFDSGNLPELARQKVTLLYAGLADSTGLAARKGDQVFTSYLNEFYQFATQLVFKHAGLVRFLGDGLLAIFVESREELSQEEQAAVVALALVDYIKTSAPPDLDRVSELAVAFNTSQAIAGYVGTRERAEFNVMGDLLKLTLRMQEVALPNRILVGEETADAVRNKYLLQKVDAFMIKGQEQPVQAYALSSGKTAPFIQTEKEIELSAAFKAIAEKLKTFGK